MYSYTWDEETGGLLLNSSPLGFSKEPRPVYYKELDLLGFDHYWQYDKNDTYPYMWAEANNYFYRGRNVAKTKGGALFTAPELIILEEPEPNGAPLRFVDVPAMVDKNRAILESLVQDTIKKIYNTYVEYQNKVDVFYVAFSGGKDSIVTLDLVQRTLPHNNFLVLFGDTGMEFPDTYDVIRKIKQKCDSVGIKFYESKSKMLPSCTWNQIGPPAQKMRWCCSVHKTAPQILLLREITNNSHFRGMAIMGVRADESISRSKYHDLNFGTKHQGQFDYYPILHWNSAELFLYLYQEHLELNETYKKGNSRAGCLVCPMEAVKNSWFKEQSYADNRENINSTTFFNNIILEKTTARGLPPQQQKEYMNIGVWKSRHNGSKLANPKIIYHEERCGNDFVITLDAISVDWKEWLKTVGEVYYPDLNTIIVQCNDSQYRIKRALVNQKHIFTVLDIGNTQKEILFLSWIKIVLKKSAYCITCQVCEANCPNGYIHMKDGKLHIDDRCIKCKKCYKVNGGCLVAASQLLPKESNKMNGSVDQYKNMGVQYNWVLEYFNKKNDFWGNNDLGSVMINSLSAFLRHAGVAEKKKITLFGELIASMGASSTNAWALMLCNLVYTPQFMWWVKNIDLNHTYTQIELDEMLKELSLTDNSRKNIISSVKNIFNTNPILSSELGLGTVTIETKGRNTYLVDVTRTSWKNPKQEVILYSLYKFAEACGGYYQFTLNRLLDFEVESDGISPAEIFGLDRETMEKILNGLSINHPDFITAQFNLDLDTITLNADKKSTDVLALF